MYEIVKILLILSYFLMTNSAGITCYQCSSTRENTGHGIRPCSEFDWSSKFQTNCPESTLCFKRNFTLPYANGNETHSIERGCTPQKLKGQKYNSAERKWHSTETIVESVYEEGCFLHVDIGRPGPPTEYCYCSSSLCNKSNSFKEISLSLITFNVVGTLLCTWREIVNFI